MNLQVFLLVNAVLFFSDVTACLNSCTVFNSVCFCTTLFSKNESSGKCRRKFLGLEDQCFENVCIESHKIVTSATVKDSCSFGLKKHGRVCKNTLWKN